MNIRQHRNRWLTGGLQIDVDAITASMLQKKPTLKRESLDFSCAKQLQWLKPHKSKSNAWESEGEREREMWDFGELFRENGRWGAGKRALNWGKWGEKKVGVDVDEFEGEKAACRFGNSAKEELFKFGVLMAGCGWPWWDLTDWCLFFYSFHSPKKYRNWQVKWPGGIWIIWGINLLLTASTR